MKGVSALSIVPQRCVYECVCVCVFSVKKCSNINGCSEILLALTAKSAERILLTLDFKQKLLNASINISTNKSQSLKSTECQVYTVEIMF